MNNQAVYCLISFRSRKKVSNEVKYYCSKISAWKEFKRSDQTVRWSTQPCLVKLFLIIFYCSRNLIDDLHLIQPKFRCRAKVMLFDPWCVTFFLPSSIISARVVLHGGSVTFTQYNFVFNSNYLCAYDLFWSWHTLNFTYESKTVGWSLLIYCQDSW